MKFATAFHRAFGRAPTAAEVASVERVCDAFEVRDNDALKAVAGVLEYYHAHLRVYPGQCTTAVQSWLRSAEGVAALGSVLQAASSSCEAQATPPAAPPQSPAGGAVRGWMLLGAFATASSALSGVLGVLAGVALSGRQPCWTARGAAVDRLIVSLIGAPAGWVLLLPLLAPACWGVKWGFEHARNARHSLVERVLGWATAVAVTGFVLVWGTLVARVLVEG